VGCESRPAASAATDRALATARWEALGSSVVLRLSAPAALGTARAMVARELDAIDRACSRFRPDSELARVNAHASGRPVEVAPLLIEALAVALRAAELTDGAVDPTVGAALVLAGYDRDWHLLAAQGDEPNTPLPSTTRADFGGGPATSAGIACTERPVVRASPRGGWRAIGLDRMRATVSVPRGIALDLGATAKAWAADRAARAAHRSVGCGVLVAIGGDIATAGAPPAGGWRIHVTDDHRSGFHAPGQTVAIAAGGLATSSTEVRRWRRGGAAMHHIIDPTTGRPVADTWRTVSVAAADCTDANIACTATLVRPFEAPAWLEQLGLPARLVDRRGRVRRIGAWPATDAGRWPAPDARQGNRGPVA
jgi:thiamine biosynthesis lipoprotein ApbE